MLKAITPFWYRVARKISNGISNTDFNAFFDFDKPLGLGTEISINANMNPSEAHGLFVYLEDGVEKKAYFTATNTVALEDPTEQRIKQIMLDLWDLGYEVESIEFLIGKQAHRAYLRKTYFLIADVDEVTTTIRREA